VRPRWAAVAALTPLLVVLTAPLAVAHATLVRSSPTQGAVVSRPLAAVTLTFDENVRPPAFVIVTGPGGTRIDDGPAQILDATVTERVTPTSVPGEYSIIYRVVSADGHPVEAVLTYTLQGPGSAAAPAASTGAAAGSPGSGVDGHWGHVLIGLAVVAAGAGALLFERMHRDRAGADGRAGSER